MLRNIKRKIKLFLLKRSNKTSVINTNKLGTGVKFGEYCKIYDGVDIREGTVGNYVRMNLDILMYTGEIGNFTSIGARTLIGLPEHPTDHMSTSRLIYHEKDSVIGGYPVNEKQSPPIIGNDVWVGSQSIILQGVNIGDGAIVAAGSIVTKDVEPYTIVAGVPAKPIKKRFDEETIEYLIDLKWWDMPLDELKKYKYLFHTGSDWINHIK